MAEEILDRGARGAGEVDAADQSIPMGATPPRAQARPVAPWDAGGRRASPSSTAPAPRRAFRKQCAAVHPRDSGDPGPQERVLLWTPGFPLARERTEKLIPRKRPQQRSPHAAQRNAGTACPAGAPVPDCASLHPGYRCRPPTAACRSPRRSRRGSAESRCLPPASGR
jgi:hypothetical protein